MYTQIKTGLLCETLQGVATEGFNCHQTLVAVNYKKLWREEGVPCEPIAAQCHWVRACPLCKYAMGTFSLCAGACGLPRCCNLAQGVRITPACCLCCVIQAGLKAAAVLPWSAGITGGQHAYLVGLPFWAGQLTFYPRGWPSFLLCGCPP